MTIGDRRRPVSGMRPGMTLPGIALSLLLTSVSPVTALTLLDAGSSLDGDGNPARSSLHQVQAGQDPNRLARDQALIGRMEEQIRRLNGRIEQLEFQQRNTNQRIDRLVEDLDQRLQTLEGGGQAPGQVGEAPGQAGSGPTELVVTPEPRQPAEEGQLGSVPETAITDLPRPDPAEVAAPEENTLTPEQQYENAVQPLQAGDYQGAQNGLEIFLELNEGHQLASNAAYWLAETHYVRQNYSAAAAAFARNYGAYGKEAPKAIDNLLKLGMALSSLGEQDKACLTYDELTGAFPTPPAHIQQALSRERARAQCG